MKFKLKYIIYSIIIMIIAVSAIVFYYLKIIETGVNYFRYTGQWGEDEFFSSIPKEGFLYNKNFQRIMAIGVDKDNAMLYVLIDKTTELKDCKIWEILDGIKSSKLIIKSKDSDVVYTFTKGYWLPPVYLIQHYNENTGTVYIHCLIAYPISETQNKELLKSDLASETENANFLEDLKCGCNISAILFIGDSIIDEPKSLILTEYSINKVLKYNQEYKDINGLENENINLLYVQGYLDFIRRNNTSFINGVKDMWNKSYKKNKRNPDWEFLKFLIERFNKKDIFLWTWLY